MTHPSIQRAKELLAQRDERNAEHEAWRAEAEARGAFDAIDDLPTPPSQRSWASQEVIHKMCEQPQPQPSPSYATDEVLAGMADEIGVITGRMERELRAEISALREEVSQLRTDVQVLRGVAKGEIAELVRRKSSVA